MKTKKWHNCCLSIIWISALTWSEVLALPPETIESIEHWRTKVLPAANLEEYWTTLKELGGKISDADAQEIEASGASDTISALALMAYRVAKAPEKVDEVRAWYGRTVDQIEQELWDEIKKRLAAKGLSERENSNARISGWSSGSRRHPPTMKLIQAVHGDKEYLPVWEAWLLTAKSDERYHMRQRMYEALVAIGNERTITILVEKCRVLREHSVRYPPQHVQQVVRNEGFEIRKTIRAIGGKAAVLGLLKYAHVLESAGFGGEATKGARYSVSLILASSYNPRLLQEQPELAESLRDPEDPQRLAPYDDKWKEFKPIIEELLEHPEDLREEDVKTLRAALDAMPK